MSVPAESFDYDSFLTLTLKNYGTKFHSQFLTNRPIVNLAMDAYKHTDNRGGRYLQDLAEYGQNPTVTMFTGAQTFSQEVAQFALPIQHEWRYIGGTMSVLHTETLENSGPVALASLTEGRMRQLMRTINIILGNELFGDGTNYGGKTIQGLQKVMSVTPTTGVVSGLDSAEYVWWRNNYRTSCGSFAANGVNGTATDYILNMFNNCTDGMTIMPTDIISDQTVFEAYNRTNLQPVRYVDAVGGTADLTFKALEYQGRKWYWDRQCPAGNVFFLNRDALHFVVDPRYLWQWTPPMSYPNQLAYTRIIGARITFRCVQRMFLGRQTGWTA